MRNRFQQHWTAGFAWGITLATLVWIGAQAVVLSLWGDRIVTLALSLPVH